MVSSRLWQLIGILIISTSEIACQEFSDDDKIQIKPNFHFMKALTKLKTGAQGGNGNDEDIIDLGLPLIKPEVKVQKVEDPDSRYYYNNYQPYYGNYQNRPYYNQQSHKQATKAPKTDPPTTQNPTTTSQLTTSEIIIPSTTTDAVSITDMVSLPTTRVSVEGGIGTGNTLFNSLGLPSYGNGYPVIFSPNFFVQANAGPYGSYGPSGYGDCVPCPCLPC